MPDKINQLDTAFFLWLNQHGASWLDPAMVWVTEKNSWIPLYVVLIGWLVWQYRRQSPGLLLVLVVAVILSDQTASALLKPLTHRLRPCHEPALQALIRPVLDCGGRFGFASSHAANAFALASGLWLLRAGRHRNAKAGANPNVGAGMNRWLWLWFGWAALLAYSRIYVGAHYPLDVLAGAGIGVGWAWLCVGLYARYWPVTSRLATTRSVTR
jgi:undecaprenyl-diphosphatase